MGKKVNTSSCAPDDDDSTIIRAEIMRLEEIRRKHGDDNGDDDRSWNYAPQFAGWIPVDRAVGLDYLRDRGFIKDEPQQQRQQRLKAKL
ncbi:hypothetical protein SLS55_006388 [Diplodia seriata]|uniref:Uncharacterized protein n=1 Tax=Diplodia seriata TaxID=420778 RepID=A0ABR3CE29_9PEZI